MPASGQFKCLGVSPWCRRLLPASSTLGNSLLLTSLHVRPCDVTISPISRSLRRPISMLILFPSLVGQEILTAMTGGTESKMREGGFLSNATKDSSFRVYLLRNDSFIMLETEEARAAIILVEEIAIMKASTRLTVRATAIVALERNWRSALAHYFSHSKNLQ